MLAPAQEEQKPRIPPRAVVLAEKERRRVRRDADAIRERCKTLHGFVREAWHVVEPHNVFVDGWHIDVICKHLEAVTWGTFLNLGYWNRLIFNVPPGTMKSLLISVMHEAWEAGPCNMAHLRNISTSYSGTYALRDSTRTRDLLLSEWYQALWPHVRLVSTGEKVYRNDQGGERRALPFGSLTAGRGDRLRIDDPHSTETAESVVERQKTARRFTEGAPTRMVDPIKSAIILIMQRLQAEDCTGVALAGDHGYIHVMLPMEFERERCCYTPLPNDTPAIVARYLATRQMWLPDNWQPASEKDLQFRDEFDRAKPQVVYRWDQRREDGELLFAKRFPLEVVERDRTIMGSYATAGQMQQRPSPRSGGMFHRGTFPFVKVAPNDCEWVRHWDLAATKKRVGNNPAWTVGLKLGRSRSSRMWYVAHIERDRLEAAAVRTIIQNVAEQDFLQHGHDIEISLPKDPGQAGAGQAHDMIAMLAAYVVHAEIESGDKMVRAEPVAAQAEAGNVFIVTGDGPMPVWVEPFFAELEVAPSGFMDQVDALSGAYTRLLTKPSGRVRVGSARGLM